MTIFRGSCRISSVNKFQDIVREKFGRIFILKLHHGAVTPLDFNISRAGKGVIIAICEGLWSLRRWKIASLTAQKEICSNIIGRVISVTIIFKFYSWTVPSLNFYVPNSMNCTGVASIKREFLCFKWSIFQLASFCIFSPFGIEVDDLLACPTDTVPRIFHGKAMTMLPLSWANFFSLSSALEVVWSPNLLSVLTKAFCP